jgi:hypothetical protein
MIVDHVWPLFSPTMRAGFSSAIVVKLQNVAEYFYQGTEQEHWDIEDFPCVVPPWPRMWGEYHTPAWINSEGRILRLDTRIEWGVAAETITMTDRMREADKSLFEALPGALANKMVDAVDYLSEPPDYPRVAEEIDRARWVVRILFFSTFFPHLMGYMTMYLDEAGRIGRHSLMSAAGASYLYRDSDQPPKDEIRWFIHLVDSGPRLVLKLALSLCNCRNVERRSTEMSPALIARRQKRGRVPVSRFYTLDIVPMQRAVREQQQARHATPIRQALHICRGHFKSYREGAGLFGKHHGLFWWDHQVRGSAQHGEVRKDYNVHSPEARQEAP